MASSISFAGENPKLFKEIQRKIKIDLSKVDLSKEKSVIVEFRIVEQRIEIINASGSNELREVMLRKLENMLITSDADCNETHYYKFTFMREGM